METQAEAEAAQTADARQHVVAEERVPRLVEKSEALRRIEDERSRAGAPSCFLCALGEGVLDAGPSLDESEHTRTVLTRYPVRWGHALVLLSEHVTSFEALSQDQWRDMSRQARRVAIAMERALHPVRCYIASLGAAVPDHPQTSPHHHLHVVPIYDAEDRPARVLTWERGVYEGTDAEWQALAAKMRAELRALP